MKEFAVRHPILFEVLLFIGAMALSLVFMLPGMAVGLNSSFNSAVGRILAGIVLLILYRRCFAECMAFSALPICLPALGFAVWNLIYNPMNGALTQVPSKLPEILVEGFAPGFFEEILFRGIFLYYLEKSGCSKMKSLLISAAVFSAVHLTNAAGGFSINLLIQLVYSFVVGLALGSIYLRCPDLVTVILVHALIDISSQIFISNGSTSIPWLIAFVVLMAAEGAYAVYALKKSESSAA